MTGNPQAPPPLTPLDDPSARVPAHPGVSYFPLSMRGANAPGGHAHDSRKSQSEPGAADWHPEAETLDPDWARLRGRIRKRRGKRRPAEVGGRETRMAEARRHGRRPGGCGEPGCRAGPRACGTPASTRACRCSDRGAPPARGDSLSTPEAASWLSLSL